MYCSTCGHGNEEGARFCLTCGQGMPVADVPLNNPIPATPPVADLPSIPAETTPKTAIAGLVLGVVGLIEATIAIASPYGGGFIATFCVIAGVFLCINSLKKSPNTRVAMAGVVSNGVTVWLVIAGFALLGLGFLGGSASSSSEPSAFPGNGLFVVGVDIAPGTYRTHGAVVGYELCRYERMAPSGNTIYEEIVPHPQQSAVVTIRESDGAFYTSGCQRWTPRR